MTLTTDDFKLKEMPQHSQNQNPFQKLFLESLKNKITDKDPATMNLLKNDANHTFHHIPSSNPPNAKERCVKGVQIHAPHIHSVCPCPCCGLGSQPKGFVAGEPLKCYDVNNYFYILTFCYTCIGCKLQFNGLNPRSIEKLSTDNKLTLDFFLLKKSAVTRTLYNLIEIQFAQLGKGGLHRFLENMYKKEYDQAILTYLADCHRLLKSGAGTTTTGQTDIKTALSDASNRSQAPSATATANAIEKMKTKVAEFWTVSPGFRFVNTSLSKLKGIGESKREDLKSNNINTVEELAAMDEEGVLALVEELKKKIAQGAQEHNAQRRGMVEGWIEKAKQHLKEKEYVRPLQRAKNDLESLEKQLEELEKQLEDLEEKLAEETALPPPSPSSDAISEENNDENNNNNKNIKGELSSNNDGNNDGGKPPFPSFYDVCGWNGSVPSERTIHLVGMDYVTRNVETAKHYIAGQTNAKVISLDETFGNASRIHIVHSNKKHSKPFASILTIVGGLGEIVGWYGLTNAESFSVEKRNILENLAKQGRNWRLSSSTIAAT